MPREINERTKRRLENRGIVEKASEVLGADD